MCWILGVVRTRADLGLCSICDEGKAVYRGHHAPLDPGDDPSGVKQSSEKCRVTITIHSFPYSSTLQTRHNGRVSVLWSRVRVFPDPRQRDLPLPGLSPDVYDMKKEGDRDPIKVGCA